MAGVVAGERPGFGEEVTEPVYLVCHQRPPRPAAAPPTRAPAGLALQASHGDYSGELACGRRPVRRQPGLPARRPLLWPGRAGDAERVVALHGRDHRPRPLRGCCSDPGSRPGGRVVRPPPHRPDRRRRSRPARPRPARTGPGSGPVPPSGSGVTGSCSVPPGPPTTACSPVAAPGRSPPKLHAAGAGRRAPGPGAQAASSATLGWTVRPSRWRVRRSSQRARNDNEALTTM